MGWLSKSVDGKVSLGPNLRYSFHDKTTGTATHPTTELDNGRLWILYPRVGLYLSQAVEWRFTNLNTAFGLLVLHSAPRGFLRVLRFPLSSKKPTFDLSCVNC